MVSDPALALPILLSYKIGIIILDEVLQIIEQYSYYFNYLDYRKIIINFQRNGLYLILEICINNFKWLLTQPNLLVDEIGLKENFSLLSLCLQYNFTMTYFEVEMDQDPREFSIISVKLISSYSRALFFL